MTTRRLFEENQGTLTEEGRQVLCNINQELEELVHALPDDIDQHDAELLIVQQVSLMFCQKRINQRMASRHELAKAFEAKG